MKIKKIIFFGLFSLFCYFIVFDANLSTIVAGVAIFLLGMYFLDSGFGLFSGGVLEKFLGRTTSTLPKAIATGTVVTAVVQSSSLVSVIAISFLSAELMGLSQAIGVIFGSNIGTTATSWIVSAFGLKIKIAQFALPMVTVGVVLRFLQDDKFKGLGNVLVGLGLIFLGIGYMKEGFDILKEGFDLSQYAMEGFYGLLIYALIGAVMTVILQSSSATVALVLTALATGQIVYINALSLAVGANVGTTVTAIIGSLTANENGKRLAVAHAIFNIITAVVALVLIDFLADLVNTIASYVGIGAEDYLLKLALFHTIFNVMGVVLVAPFTGVLVHFLKTLFVPKGVDAYKPKYLNDTVVTIPTSAQVAISKEVTRMYEKSLKTLTHAMSLHRSELFSDGDLEKIVENSGRSIKTDVDREYHGRLKELYSGIIHYSSLAQHYMGEDESEKVSDMKIAARKIIESVKDIRELQRNIDRYLKSNNKVIVAEYNFIRRELAYTLKEIELIRGDAMDDIDKLEKLELMRGRIAELDYIESGRIDKLLHKESLNARVAASLINDSAFAHSIARKLLEVAAVLWIEDQDILQLGEEDGY